MTALETSWPRQWLMARERRRRFGGSGDDIVDEVAASYRCGMSGRRGNRYEDIGMLEVSNS